MDAAMIHRLIQNLGRPYEELVADGVVSSAQPLIRLFEDDDELIQKPAPGVSLWFQVETGWLEKVTITLVKMVDRQSLYVGSLPSPYSLRMNISSVRALMGEPMQTKGSARVPGSGGVISGGWDAYRLHRQLHPNARVGFSYMADMTVHTLAFALLDED